MAAGAPGLGGCATPAGAAEPLDSRSYSLESAVAEAVAEGAGAAQVAALRQAAETGSVTVEAVREAAHRAVICMGNSGIEAHVDETTLSHGVVLPGYSADARDDAEAVAQVEVCDSREHFWVGKAYQLQASSVEAMNRHVEERAPEIRAWLEEHGVPTGDARSGAELAELASRAMHESLGVSCLAEAGVDAW